MFWLLRLKTTALVKEHVLGEPVQVKEDYTKQEEEQPSKSRRLPSSHPSSALTKIPSPQTVLHC